MSFMTAKQARPVDDPKALVPFGWAPGDYYCAKCSDCGEPHHGSDKRSARCQDCAEALRDATASMTHPLTPREKVPYSLSEISEEIRRRYPAAFDGSDPIGLHPPSLENATDLFLSVCLTALASGSGDHSGGVTDMIGSGAHADHSGGVTTMVDHAGLARTVEAMRRAEHDAENAPTSLEKSNARRALKDMQRFMGTKAPALLAENAALRVRVETERRLSVENYNRADARATEAERKLAEAEAENTRWAFRFAEVREAAGIGVKPMLSEVPGEIRKMRERLNEIVRDIAETPYTGADWPRERARTFLSKEAERG